MREAKKMTRTRSLVAATLALLLLSSLTTSLALAAPPAQDPANGKVLWEKNLCQKCHGAAGEGMWALPLAGSQKTAEEWIAQVRSPRSRMPHFSPEKVTDQMIIDMHAYLTSLPKPVSFTPADAGLPADAPAGQKLVVDKKCVACHTTTGPIQPFMARGETPTVEAVIKQLRTPKQFMPMFTAEQVSDAEAGQIAEFLVSQAAPASLPATGSSVPSIWPIALLILGTASLLAGFAVRSRSARS
jgi:mono/diheme cytochrome c family protein